MKKRTVRDFGRVEQALSSQFSIKLRLGRLSVAPSQNPRCAVNASGSPRWPSRPDKPGSSAIESICHPKSGTVSRGCSFPIASIALPPSLHQSFPASSVLCNLPTSHRHQINYPLGIGVSYSRSEISFLRNLRDLTGCLEIIVCNENGTSTPGLRSCLAIAT